jgi:hypothetical protein
MACFRHCAACGLRHELFSASSTDFSNLNMQENKVVHGSSSNRKLLNVELKIEVHRRSGC